MSSLEFVADTPNEITHYFEWSSEILSFNFTYRWQKRILTSTVVPLRAQYTGTILRELTLDGSGNRPKTIHMHPYMSVMCWSANDLDVSPEKVRQSGTAGDCVTKGRVRVEKEQEKKHVLYPGQQSSQAFLQNMYQ